MTSLSIVEIQDLFKQEWVWNISQSYLNSKSFLKFNRNSKASFRKIENELFIQTNTVLYAIISDKGTHSELGEFFKLLTYIKNLKMDDIETKIKIQKSCDDSDSESEDERPAKRGQVSAVKKFGPISLDYIHTQYLLAKIKDLKKTQVVQEKVDSASENSAKNLEYYKDLGRILLKNKEVYVVKFFYKDAHYIKMYNSENHYYEEVKTKLVNDNKPFLEEKEIIGNKDFKLLHCTNNVNIYVRTSDKVNINELKKFCISN